MNTRAQMAEGTTRQPNEAMLMGCPACGSRISKRAPSCPKCGIAPYSQCLICASQILSNAAPCPECGDPQPFDAAQTR